MNELERSMNRWFKDLWCTIIWGCRRRDPQNHHSLDMLHASPRSSSCVKILFLSASIFLETSSKQSGKQCSVSVIMSALILKQPKTLCTFVLLAAMGIAASPLGVTSPFFPCPISDSPIQGKPFGCAKVFSWIISNLFSSPSATLNLVINCSSFLLFRHWPLRARTSGWRVMAAFRNEPSFPFPGEKRITDSHPNKSNNQILKYYSKTLPKEKYQKCQVIQLKQLQWASQIWCRRKFAAWVSSRLWTLQKFTTVGSKASSYFILWEAAFMQSLQVKHLLYLDSKSIIEKIRAAWSTWTTPKFSISSECPKRIVQADLHHHPRLDASTVLVQPEKNIFSSSTFVEILWGVSMLTRILLVKNPARESTAWHWSQLIPLKKNHEKAVVIQVHGTRLWSV